MNFRINSLLPATARLAKDPVFIYLPGVSPWVFDFNV